MMNDEQIINQFGMLVELLNETKGTNAKKDIIKQHEFLKPLIKRIWDPETKTHVTKKGLETWAAKKGNADKSKLHLFDLFDQLTSGELSGDRAKSEIWGYIRVYPDYEDLLLRIFEKDPRVRLGATIMLQIFPDLFVIFKVALAQEYTQEDFEKAYNAAGKAWISKKIDGMRLIVIIRDGDVKFYSRKGNLVTSLAVLQKDIQAHLLPLLTADEIKGTVIDGEVVALNPDGTENFKLTVSEARKKDVEMKNPQFKMFDFMSLKTFESGSNVLFEERLKRLQQLKDTKHMVVLEQTPYSKEAFTRLSSLAKKEGWEGLMIRMNTKYENKRSRNLLKYKFICQEEYKVIDVVIEDMKFPNSNGGEDTTRALNSVIIHHKKNNVNVGSGFSKEERIEFAKNPDNIKGKIISIKFQEEFYDEKKNLYSLRCPIYQGIVGDKVREV